MPWLILFACLLVGFQPLISRWARSRPSFDPDADRTLFSGRVTAASTVVGVYGGYFGAGQGVMLVAVMALGLDLELRVVNALKTTAIMAANIVAGVIFVAIADLDWLAIGLLASAPWSAATSGRTWGGDSHRRCSASSWSSAGVTAAVVML